jgi:sialic acid synthase SpsE
MVEDYGSMTRFRIGDRWVGGAEPTYFIADISANHDGDLERAKALIHLAADAGADAAKFQNFRAATIVSEHGFDSLGTKFSHQAQWRKSVYQTYQDASLPWDWTPILKAECDRAGIDYFSTPYDLETVDMLAPFVPVFKIGSGDITWPEILLKIASAEKPVILATGASTIGDVQRAVHILQSVGSGLALMQCNTNYTGSIENFKSIHLNVLRGYRELFPDVVLGLSDHTRGHSTALGAVALGARVIEKHFTDDVGREGPDHPFSMTPHTWREMVARTRELELALGDADKRVADNEYDTVVLQRRCLRAATELEVGRAVTRHDIDVLRPAPADAIPPYEMNGVIGRRLRVSLRRGDYLRWTILE